MIGAFRIDSAAKAGSTMSGEDARRSGGRWSSPGVAVVYMAGSLPLAILEKLVHMEADQTLGMYVLQRASFEGCLVDVWPVERCPADWRQLHLSPSTRCVGDQWAAEGRSAVLAVPSAIVPEEWNYLLNPSHRDFGKVVVGAQEPFSFDPRLCKTRKA